MKSLSPILSEINENVAAMFVRYWCKGTRTLISRNLFSIQQNLSPIDLRYGFYLSFWRRVKHKNFLDENVSCNGVRNFYCGGSLNNRRIGAAVPDTTLCVPVMFAIFCWGGSLLDPAVHSLHFAMKVETACEVGRRWIQERNDN